MCITILLPACFSVPQDDYIPFQSYCFHKKCHVPTDIRFEIFLGDLKLQSISFLGTFLARWLSEYLPVLLLLPCYYVHHGLLDRDITLFFLQDTEVDAEYFDLLMQSLILSS